MKQRGYLRTWLLVGLIGLLLTGCGVGGGNTADDGKALNEFSFYDLSFAIPMSWPAEVNEEEDDYLEFSEIGGNTWFGLGIAPVMADEMDLSLDELWEIYFTELVEFSSSRMSAIDGNEALLVEYHTGDDRLAAGYIVLVRFNEQLYTPRMFCDEAAWGTCQPVFDAILDSMTLEK